MSISGRQLLRYLSSAAVTASTFLQDVVTLLALEINLPASIVISAVCALIDGAEYGVFQGDVIEHGPGNQRASQNEPNRRNYEEIDSEELVSCSSKLCSRSLQTASLVVSLWNAGSDRWFILHSLVDVFNDLKVSDVRNLEVNPYFWSIFVPTVLLALLGRTGTDNYEVNRAISEKFEKVGAKPIQAGFFRCIGGQNKRVRAVLTGLTATESAVFEDVVPTALLASLVLSVVTEEGVDLTTKIAVTLGVGGFLGIASIPTYLIQANAFDGATMRDNMLDSCNLPPLPVKRKEVSAARHRWTKICLTIGSFFRGLNLSAPATLAFLAFIKYLQSEDVSDQTRELSLPLLITVATFFAFMTTVGAVCNQYSEVDEAMSTFHQEEARPKVEEVDADEEEAAALYPKSPTIN